MKLYKYEFHKLWGIRWLRFMVVAFLVVNVLLTLYHANQKDDTRAVNKKIEEFYDLYEQDPEGMEAYYQELLREYNASVSEGGDRTDQGGHRYAPEGYTDTRLFTDRRLVERNANAYATRMQKAVERAELNLRELRAMGISDDSYNSQFQMTIMERYAYLGENVRIPVEHIYGWDTYFSYDSVVLLLFLILTVVVAAVISCDSSADFDRVIHCTRLGKAGTIRAKMGVICIASVALTLLFSLTSFAVVALRCGLSSPQTVIQALSGYELAQYVMSIGEYFAVSLLVRVLSCLAFIALLSALAVHLRDQLLICGAGVLFSAGNLLLYLLPYGGAEPAYKYLNFMSVMLGEPLFLRFRALNGFGSVWAYVPVALVACGVCVVVGSLWAVLLYPQLRSGRARGKRAKELVAYVTGRVGKHLTPKARIRRRPHTLWSAEVQKLTARRGLILLVLLLIIGKTVYTIRDFNPLSSYTDKIFLSYMTEYGGPVTDEKLTALENERAEIEEILSAYEGMGQDYVNGRITKEEYTAYLERHEAAGNRSEFLRKTEERRDYLVSLREEGREGWFLYDTGWKKLTCADPDYFLYAAILLLCAGIFAVEYSRDDTREGFIRILRSTGNGHAQTFFVKLSVAVAAAVILSILFTVIDVSVAAYYYELPNFAAPLRSIEIFYSMKGSLSVGGYLTVMTAIRCFASVILAVWVVALSALTRRSFTTLVIAVSTTLLPAFLDKLNVTVARYLNVQTVLAGYPLILSSARSNTFDGDWTLVLTVLIGLVFVTAILVGAAYRKYEKMEG